MSTIAASVLITALMLPHASTAAEFALVPLQLGQYEIQVQLADTTEKRMQGLMGQIPLKHGLILLYETPHEISLWMKNTPSALDVAFIDEHWVVRSLTSMEPFSLTTHSSKGLAIAALEMPKGWFAAHQIHVGSTITYCPKASETCLQQRPKLIVIPGV